MLRNGGYVMPIICGHEFSGYVEQLGEGVTDFELGDLVSVPPLIPCYHCDFCVRGEFGLCVDTHVAAVQVGIGCRSRRAGRVQRGEILVPVRERGERAGLEPRGLAHALWKTGAPGTGSGRRGWSIGLFTPVGEAGWRGPDCDGRCERRSAMAREAGATGAVQTHDEAKALAGRGFDIVLESAGGPVTADMAAHLTGPQGHAVFVGIPHAPVTLSKETFNQFMRLEVTLHGSWNSFSAPFPGDEWRTAAYKLANGELKWELMITHELPLSELPAMMVKLGDRSEFTSKVIFLPNRG